MIWLYFFLLDFNKYFKIQSLLQRRNAQKLAYRRIKSLQRWIALGVFLSLFIYFYNNQYLNFLHSDQESEENYFPIIWPKSGKKFNKHKVQFIFKKY